MKEVDSLQVTHPVSLYLSLSSPLYQTGLARLGSCIDMTDGSHPTLSYHPSGAWVNFQAAQGEEWSSLPLLSAGQAEGKLDHPWRSDHHLEGFMAFVPNVCKTSEPGSSNPQAAQSEHGAVSPTLPWLSKCKQSLRRVLAFRLHGQVLGNEGTWRPREGLGAPPSSSS